MTIATDNPARRSWFGYGVLVLVIIAMAAIGYGAYRAVSVASQAEENLHATIFAICLVEQFVAERGNWPRSWNELETLSVSPGASGSYDWPSESARIQQHVVIDFSPDLAAIAGQDPMVFTAIRPIGPRYEYRDYGFVPSLQRTLQKLLAK